MNFRRGKKPAKPDAIKLRFGSYFKNTLPTAPTEIGRPGAVKDWRMLANDTAADCVQAGAAHETMKLVSDAGRTPPLFTPTSVLSDYRYVNPDDAMYKDGTDVSVYARFRQNVGIVDSSGLRHKIELYAAIEPGNTEQIAQCIWWFGACGIGVQLPDDAETHMDWNLPWSATSAPPGEGHYISALYRDANGNFLCCTWGRLVTVTPKWLERYMDEGLAIFSRERASQVLPPENWAQLLDDFKQVTA